MAQLADIPNAEVTSADDVIQLSFNDHRLVVMTRQSMDKLVFPVARAISACANQATADAIERTMREKFYGLVTHICEWCKRHAPVKAALLDPRDQGRYLLVLVVDNEHADAGLGEDVPAFSMDLYRKYPEYPVSVMSVPVTKPSAIETFVDPQRALLVYALDPRTPRHG